MRRTSQAFAALSIGVGALIGGSGCGGTPNPTVPWSPIPGAQSAPWPGATAIQVRTSFTPPCVAQVASVTLTSGAQVLGQWSLYPSSPLEIHVAPGTYQVLANASGNCVAQQHVQALANQVVPVTLWLGVQYTSAWSRIRNWFGGDRAPAHDPSAPRIPCNWKERGCEGSQLPAAATALLARSHLSWVAPAAEFNVRMKPLSRALRTDATPIHGVDGWRLRRASPDDSSSEVAYGLAFSEQDLQRENGFCVAQPDLMTMLQKHLRDRGHSGVALKNFEAFWTPRLPNALRYCVYPQDERQIDALAALEIKPRPARVLRTWFWIVPIEERLARGPNPPSKYRTNPVIREPASESRLEEAGVIFPVQAERAP